MSARTLATASTRVGPRPPLLERPGAAEAAGAIAVPTATETAPPIAISSMAVRLTGASMRLLEVSIAAAAMTTALLIGVGR